MMRSFFLAFGISLCILGGECLVVDHAVVNVPNREAASEPVPAYYGEPQPPPARFTQREVTPPEWAPWTLLSAGVVVTLYALTVRRG